MQDSMRDERGAPKIVDRSTFQAELDALRVREKAHTREGDAIAAAADGSPWSRWTVPHRSLANVARSVFRLTVSLMSGVAAAGSGYDGCTE